MSKRRAISWSLRYSVFERDNYTCQYCGSKAPDVVLHLDHVYPVALGGENKIDNLLTACRHCNIGKGARDPGLAMPSRPPTPRERQAEAIDDAQGWAECAFWEADLTVKRLMWEMAAKAAENGVLLTLPMPRDGAERAEFGRLLAGLVAVGAARTRRYAGDEWCLELELDRGRVDDPAPMWGLGAIGPISRAPSVGEVYG